MTDQIEPLVDDLIIIKQEDIVTVAQARSIDLTIID